MSVVVGLFIRFFVCLLACLFTFVPSITLFRQTARVSRHVSQLHFVWRWFSCACCVSVERRQRPRRIRRTMVLGTVFGGLPSSCLCGSMLLCALVVIPCGALAVDVHFESVHGVAQVTRGWRYPRTRHRQSMEAAELCGIDTDGNIFCDLSRLNWTSWR